MQNQSPKINLRKRIQSDLEDNFDVNLNIDNELKFKSNEKILNSLLNKYMGPRINKINNNSFNTRGSVDLNSLNKINTNIFPNNKAITKKEVIKTLSGFFNNRKRASIKNFKKENSELLNLNYKKDSLSKINKFKKKLKNDVSSDDLYFEDDMFIPESSSFPNENEQDFLLKLQFIEDNDYNEDFIDYRIRNNSISYKINNKDNIHMKYFKKNNKEKENKFEKKVSDENKINNLYNNEKEEIGTNILYTDSLKYCKNIKNISQIKSIINDLEKNNYLNMQNDLYDSNISYMSINLLIKKIAVENFRLTNPYLMKCFMQQFKYFITLNNMIGKIISAFKYYQSLEKLNTELILFLNEIVLENYNEISLDENNIQQVKNFYRNIKNIKWNNLQINQNLKSIENLLNKKDSGNKINKKKSIISVNSNINYKIERKKCTYSIKSKTFYIRNFVNEIKEKVKKHNYNYNYFYIFDYTKEEIAAYLTIDSYKLLSNIPEEEFFNKRFAGKSKEEKAPNIMKIIKRHDNLVLFIIEDICSYDHKNERVEIIEKWIRIGYMCLQMKNFNDLIMINSLFSNYLFKKMKLTWEKLSKKSLNYIEELNKFCSGNRCYIKIRKEIFKCKGTPYVPYLGILLKEIMGIEEMKYIIDNNNINFLKIIKLSKTINHFFEFKERNYFFDKLANLEILSNVNPLKSEEIEEIIKKIEPTLTISAEKGDKKRLTKSDKEFYNKEKNL